MGRNFLKLNDDKTGVLLMSSSHQLKKISMPAVMVGHAMVAPSAMVRNLGATSDLNMTLVPHVSAVCRSARYHTGNLGKIRGFLDRDSYEKLVHVFVTSWLDLNNGLLVGITGDAVGKLQLVQNMAARVVSRTRVNEHITPVLMGLHWLPVQQRIQHKVLLLAYKAQR